MHNDQNSDREFRTIQPGFRQAVESRSAPNFDISGRQQGGFQPPRMRDDLPDYRPQQMG